MRERVEDLGRLSVLLKNMLDHSLFDESKLPRRPKDSWIWWKDMTDAHREDVLHNWAYGIQDLQDKICESLNIAEGQDTLNEPHPP